MNAACPVCKGSGETGAYGVLDCSAPNCIAAAERLALEVAAAEASLTDYDARWLAYTLSKAKALEEAAKICESVNNYDNPMTAGDCADAIRSLKDK